MQRRNLVIAAVLLGCLIFVSGLLAGQYLSSPRSARSPDKLSVEGYGVIKAYNPSGALIATWQGYNTLTANGISALSQCLSGQATGGTILGGSCTGIIASLEVDDTNYNTYYGAATSTLTPSGCNPLANPGTCTGWQSTATISFSSITSSVTIMRAESDGASDAAFDTLSITPNIVVTPGDSMIVTITFTVS